MKIGIFSKAELPSAATKLLQSYPKTRVFCFFGEMGVGKTTFIKVLCQQLGAIDTTSSPTFAIINEYLTNTQESIYHFDFYRIEKIEDAYEIGVEEYLYSGNYCFIEWSENILPLIDADFAKVHITIEADNKRCITVE